MKKLHFLTLIACAWVLCPLKTQAQSTYALIVGISQYKEMPVRQYADRDALAFAEFVKGQGVPDQNISLFLNEDATRMNIVDELYRLSRTLKPQDRFYFYFGGHGDLEAKIGYENAMLLLHGCFKTGYFQGKEFMQLSELKTWLTALSKTQTQVIFITDSNNFHYRIEPHEEMFLLNLEQNKMETAIQWLEKALQVSVSEKGNDTSGTSYRNAVLETYKNLDVNAFNALYEKYFPKTDEKK